MLQKVGRFLASRVQGTKGKQKYDKYMKENPWARTALGVGRHFLCKVAAA